MGKNYIPGRDADFDKWFKFMNQYVAQKCAGATPAWPHIPQAARTAMEDAYIDWYTAYSITLKPCTSQEKAEKRRVRKAAEKVIRPFVNQYLRYPPVTDEDRDNMGIPNHDTTHTPVDRPETQPEADVAYPGVHMVELNHIRTVGGLDDPRSEFGVRIFWGILGPPTTRDKVRLSAPPVTGDDLPHSTFTHRKKYRFNFDGDSGKTVYFCLRYENEKGGEDGEGPFGPIFSAVIP